MKRLRQFIHVIKPTGFLAATLLNTNAISIFRYFISIVDTTVL